MRSARIYVAIILALASVGTLNTLWRWLPDAPLGGVQAELRRPVFSFDEVLAETFQRDATLWFERHWSLRGVAVRTDNTVNVSLFHETRPGQSVKVLNGGVLISEEDLWYFNRADNPDLDEKTKQQAQALAKLQRRLKERNTLLLPLILPSKSSFVADSIPTRWRREGAAAQTDVAVYQLLVRTFQETGAVFVDGRALLAADSVSRPGYEVFPKTGRHLRLSAACRMLQATLDTARLHLGWQKKALDCRFRDSVPTLEGGETDLFRVMNVWNEADVRGEVFEGTAADSSPDPSVLFVGSSFQFAMQLAARKLGVIQDSLLYYYNSSRTETRTGNVLGKVEPFTKQWRTETLARDVIVVELLETFMPGEPQGLIEQLNQALDAPTALE